jgi:hypothetical protein
MIWELLKWHAKTVVEFQIICFEGIDGISGQSVFERDWVTEAIEDCVKVAGNESVAILEKECSN